MYKTYMENGAYRVTIYLALILTGLLPRAFADTKLSSSYQLEIVAARTPFATARDKREIIATCSSIKASVAGNMDKIAESEFELSRSQIKSDTRSELWIWTGGPRFSNRYGYNCYLSLESRHKDFVYVHGRSVQFQSLEACNGFVGDIRKFRSNLIFDRIETAKPLLGSWRCWVEYVELVRGVPDTPRRGD